MGSLEVSIGNPWKSSINTTNGESHVEFGAFNGRFGWNIYGTYVQKDGKILPINN